MATVTGDAQRAAIRAAQGVMLEDGLVVPTGAHAPGARRNQWIFKSLSPKAESAKCADCAGSSVLTVERLVRIQFGPVRFGRLASGDVASADSEGAFGALRSS